MQGLGFNPQQKHGNGAGEGSFTKRGEKERKEGRNKFQVKVTDFFSAVP